MTIRMLHLPTDFSLFTDLLPATFQYPENEAWNVQPDEEETLVDAAKSLKRFWPLISFFQKFNPELGELMSGFVWEENNKPVGIVNYQRAGKTNRFYITNVSVLPEFRRRGIARKLVELGLENIKQQGGEHILLDVISDNVPAYNLYESLGFEYFTGSTELNHVGEKTRDPEPLPSDYTIEKSDGQLRYQLEKRIMPADVQAFDPVVENRYKQPAAIKLMLPIIWMASGIKETETIYRSTKDNQVIGWARIQRRTRRGGQNIINARLDPAHAHFATPLVRRLLHEIAQKSPGRRTVFDIPTWQPHLIEAALAEGLEKRWEFRKMVKKAGENA